MIRVALVITELDVGGAERQLVNLATGLDPRWYKTRVYALGAPPPAGQHQLVERLTEASIPVEFLGARRWWQFGPTVQKLSALLQEFRPHLVQSFLFHANVVGTLAARQAGVPKVCLGIRVAEPRRWRWWLERRIARQADRVVCVSQAVGRVARERLNLPGEKLVVIPNGIALDEFQVEPADIASLGVPAGRKVITFVGRMDRQKGIDRLLDLAPQFLKGADYHRHLLLVGDGPLRSVLERRASQLQLEQQVTFAGWQADVPALLAASELLVLPSRYEGMPNALLEAMASGLPVVTTAAEGVREILGDDNSQIVPTVDERFAERIDHFLSNPAERGLYGQQNREIVAARFSLPGMIRAYERLFAELSSGMPGTAFGTEVVS